MSEPEPAVEETPQRVTDTETLFSLLGRAHTMEILHQVVMGDQESLRFGDLQETLDLSPNTLSRRLNELVEIGLLERTQYDEIPPRVEYEPTDRLLALKPMFGELRNWMEEYGNGTFCHEEE